ncbi:MAG: XrtA/PEP-CTERM system histidine kinase PrsK, partial [Sphingomicrobium sp.]
SALAQHSETARNLVWLGLLYALSTASDGRQRGVAWVYGAVAAVLGLQFVTTFFAVYDPSPAALATSAILRITAAAGALILVHNFYGQSAPATRTQVRFTMIGLAMMWVYDLNYYTIDYLGGGHSSLADWRGLLVLLTAPLFALGAHQDKDWRVKLSRTASFQSLSILAICAYFALMVILSTALRDSASDWLTSVTVAALAAMTVAAMVIIPSRRARGWVKVKLAKHLFEHRYDYRAEWLRFTATVGRTTEETPAPLSERIVMAFADVLEAPGGLLLAVDGQTPSISASWNWSSALPAAAQLDDQPQFWASLAADARIIELDALRGGWASPRDRQIALPGWLLADTSTWTAIPLVHEGRTVGLVVLAAPDYRRALDWEDYDLLRTAGAQAASSLADALKQEALATAQRFEEFNRRFAFILHDIKNLVSQLSLLARNAERHSGNPEFQADMVATLKSSVAKMNDLLARLAPQDPPRVQRVEARPLRPILTEAIAAARGGREIELSGDSSAWAQVDSAALEQALANLLHNALEASPLIEPVTVRVDRSGADVAIAVSDRGYGMDSDFVRNRLFLPFASTKTSGFGIGAFEARSLILAMGGRLTVESNVGTGTTFTIFVPAAEAVRSAERKRA